LHAGEELVEVRDRDEGSHSRQLTISSSSTGRDL
jgi:hypothetical protein